MAINERIAQYREEMTELLTELIRIPSVQGAPEPGKPFGAEVDNALQLALEKARAMGFKTVRNVDGYVGIVEIGQGEGEIGIITHLDVVPAGDGWTMDPFAGIVKDGVVYGRGAADDKGAAVAALFALRALEEEGVTLKKRVRLILGTNEETGMEDVVYLFEKEHMPDYAFSPDSDYPIINVEKGIVQVEAERALAPTTGEGIRIVCVKAGQRPNVIPGAATAVLLAPDPSTIGYEVNEYNRTAEHKMRFEVSGNTVTLTATGAVGHAARPHLACNAAGLLVDFLVKLPLAQGDAEQALRDVAAHIGATAYGERLHINFEDEVSGKLTCNLGILNIENDKARFVLDIRHPVSYENEQIFELVKSAMAGTQFAFAMGHTAPNHMVPADHPLVKRLLAAYVAETGGEPYCIAIGGGSYGRKMPNRCVAFGPTFPGQPRLAHMADENMGIDDMVTNARIMARACIELAGEDW